VNGTSTAAARAARTSGSRAPRSGATLAYSLLIALGCGCAAPRSAGAGTYGAVPQGALAVVAEVRAKRGKESELRATTLPLVAAVRAEPGNLLYFLHEDREDSGHFVFYEIFATEADFEAHNATAHVRAWFARLPELAEGDVKVTRLALRGH
jgi:quinol monooxygenase YgiN